MFYTKFPTHLSKCFGSVTTPVIGHQPPYFYAKFGIPGNSIFQELDGADSFLVGKQGGKGQAGMVINTDVQVFVTYALNAPLASYFVGYTVSWAGKTGEFLDIDVDHVAGIGKLIAVFRPLWFQVFHAR